MPGVTEARLGPHGAPVAALIGAREVGDPAAGLRTPSPPRETATQ
jgi:hypothetical protein